MSLSSHHERRKLSITEQKQPNPLQTTNPYPSAKGYRNEGTDSTSNYIKSRKQYNVWETVHLIQALRLGQ